MLEWAAAQTKLVKHRLALTAATADLHPTSLLLYSKGQASNSASPVDILTDS